MKKIGKREIKKIESCLERVFDLTKSYGFWLTKEDQQFHRLQLQSKAQIVYCSTSFAGKYPIHPSKRIKSV